MKFRGFQFSFKKDMLEMTEKSSEIYRVYSRPEFYNLTTNIYGVCTSNDELTNTYMTVMF